MSVKLSIGPKVQLNIIKNFWAKRRLAGHTVSWEKFEYKVQDIWNSVDQETSDKIYDSILDRLKAVMGSTGLFSRF